MMIRGYGVEAHDYSELLWSSVTEHGSQLKRQTETGLGIDKGQDHMDEHETYQEGPSQQDFYKRSFFGPLQVPFFCETPGDLFFRWAPTR